MKNSAKSFYIAIVLWTLCSFVWNPFWITYSNKIFAPFFQNGQSIWLVSVGDFAETMLGEAILPLCLYILVVRPYVKVPLLNTRFPKRYRFIILTLFLCVGYFLLVPRVLYQYDATAHLTLGATFLGVGLCEEWSFRGVMTRVAKDRFGLLGAVVVSSIMFALSHWANTGNRIFSAVWTQKLGVYLVFGVLLCVIAWRGLSLVWVAFVHFMVDWNPLSFGEPHWLPTVMNPLLMDQAIVFLFGLIGAEVLRAFTKAPQIRAFEVTHFAQ